MKSIYSEVFSQIRNLNFQMEVLEALEWDEEESIVFNKCLFELLSSCTSHDELRKKLSDKYNITIVSLVFDLLKNHEKDLLKQSKGEGDIEA
jgi:hypothetical protein|tara:strand:- start:393 stop:668 length:276 start_codon:yes stop_codon:yes gene_type:complete